jgi:hypothetical protein
VIVICNENSLKRARMSQRKITAPESSEDEQPSSLSEDDQPSPGTAGLMPAASREVLRADMATFFCTSRWLSALWRPDFSRRKVSRVSTILIPAEQPHSHFIGQFQYMLRVVSCSSFHMWKSVGDPTWFSSMRRSPA